MKVLIIAVHENIIHNSIFNLFGAAHKICTKFDILSIGTQEQANELGQYAGVHNILHVQQPTNLFAENLAPLIAELAQNYTHVLINANSFGKNILPRVAGKLQIGQISEITEVVSPNIFKKFMYASNVLVEIESLEDIKLLSVRVANFHEYKHLTSSDATVIIIDKPLYNDHRIKFISKNSNSGDTVDLSNASIVVSGGRSLINRDNFDSHIRILANNLGAAVGATRAAVEAGLAPNGCQIGQTGKVVAPQLYIAIGISGAVQHIAGMKDSKQVLAINIDPNAQIFEYANYGLVADLFETVPQLIDKLKNIIKEK